MAIQFLLLLSAHCLCITKSVGSDYVEKSVAQSGTTSIVTIGSDGESLKFRNFNMPVRIRHMNCTEKLTDSEAEYLRVIDERSDQE